MYRISIFLLLFLPWLGKAQSTSNATLWTPISGLSKSDTKRLITPLTCKAFELDLNALNMQLINAPMERTPKAKTSPVIVEIPFSNGTINQFEVWESPIMEKGLADRYPNIRTYAGRAVNNPSTTIRFDVTPQGFHAIIYTQKSGTIFIDPLYHGQDDLYQVYDRKNFLPTAEKAFICHNQHDNKNNPTADESTDKLFGDCSLHTYRLALSCNGEYAQFHGGTVPLVLGAMVTTMNRVNGVFEKDFAVRMNLVANNDTLIFFNAQTDPFSDDIGLMGGENQALLDSVIGSNNYDIGHVFGVSGGGYAAYGAVCNAGAKAIGYTGTGSPVGDPFDIDYVAHEMGHQFSGSHPFRGCGNNNVIDIAAVEPGSGSTIMAYAGICGDNVQFNSDDYFHGFNLFEMSNFVVNTGGQTCGVHTPLNNSSPVVNGSTLQYVVPAGTPFFLTASASDPDGDPITYCWEQFDTELSPQPPLSTSTGGPNFRTYSPTTSPTRYFPALDALASGLPLTWEVLPSVSRTMNFRVSVRDNAIGGGCTEQGFASVAVNDAAGPFIVTNPSLAGIVWTAGGQALVEWNTANTEYNPVNCAAVDILLSTDGGLTYPTTLATGVPNNGVHPVNVPNISTNTARVMVVSAGNVFFDISNNDFSIVQPQSAFLLLCNPVSYISCASNTVDIAINSVAFGGFSGTLALTVSNLPQGVTAAFANTSISAGAQTTLTLNGLLTAQEGLYTITITGNSNGLIRTVSFVLNIERLPSLPSALLVPVNGAVNAPISPLFIWTSVASADTYTIQISNSSNFSTILHEQSGIGTNQYQCPVSLPYQTTLYWRIRANSGCGSGAFSSVSQFSTTNFICTTISSTDLPLSIDNLVVDTVSTTVNFPINGIIHDVNIPTLIGTHEYIQDLVFDLTSPSGTVCRLMSSVCGAEDNFEINFDDQAALAYNLIPCPPTDGLTYQPNTPLSIFNNESSLGDWTLNVYDVYPQDGGSLTDWSLELCYFNNAPSGCSLSATALVTSSSCAACESDVAVTLNNVTGQAVYVWDDGSLSAVRNNLCAGNYSLTVYDAASCQVTLPVTVAEPNFISGATSTPDFGTNNGTATATTTGGQAPFSYLWSNGGTTSSLQQLTAGLYSVTITDANSCTASASVQVQLAIGVNEANIANDFTLVPNPTSGNLQAILSFAQEEELVIDIYNANGQLLQHAVHNGSHATLSFDLSNEPNGVYLLSAKTSKGYIVKRIVLLR